MDGDGDGVVKPTYCHHLKVPTYFIHIILTHDPLIPGPCESAVAIETLEQAASLLSELLFWKIQQHLLANRSAEQSSAVI